MVILVQNLNGRAVSFAVLLYLYHLKIRRVSERDVDFAQLLQATFTLSFGLDESLQHIAPPLKDSASVRLSPELPHSRVSPIFASFVLFFDGSAKTEKHGGYGSCSWML